MLRISMIWLLVLHGYVLTMLLSPTSQASPRVSLARSGRTPERWVCNMPELLYIFFWAGLILNKDGSDLKIGSDCVFSNSLCNTYFGLCGSLCAVCFFMRVVPAAFAGIFTHHPWAVGWDRVGICFPAVDSESAGDMTQCWQCRPFISHCYRARYLATYDIVRQLFYAEHRFLDLLVVQVSRPVPLARLGHTPMRQVSTRTQSKARRCLGAYGHWGRIEWRSAAFIRNAAWSESEGTPNPIPFCRQSDGSLRVPSLSHTITIPSGYLGTTRAMLRGLRFLYLCQYLCTIQVGLVTGREAGAIAANGFRS